MVTMCATVLEVLCDQLLVCDQSNCQQVLVNTPKACCFTGGDRVCIQYDGVMTMSIPPQISASSITLVNSSC